jgi:hypothetical protein
VRVVGHPPLGHDEILFGCFNLALDRHFYPQDLSLNRQHYGGQPTKAQAISDGWMTESDG